jgi:Protein of unknown function (DUF1761)
MSLWVAVAIAAVCVFVTSSLWYVLLSPVEARWLGAAARARGGRPAPGKVALELARSVVVTAAIAGIARHAHVHGAGPTAVLGLVPWVGFPLVLLTGSVAWEHVPPVTAALHAGDWLVKLIVCSLIVGAAL